MNILAIESSCDETACAIVRDGVFEVSSVVASSKELHEATGGVVPEIAARKQVEFIVPVIDRTIKKAGIGFSHLGEGIDAVAVTVGPGLIGSLLVGVEAAKTLALAWEKPLVPVNHLVGHIYGNFIKRTDLKGNTTQFGAEKVSFPCVVLIISGGHTDLVLMRDHGDLAYLGGTLDDAAGEAYDKTARLLGLAKYLGGAELSKLAATCTTNLAKGLLPRPMLNTLNLVEDPTITTDNKINLNNFQSTFEGVFDFSFSGLKTAVKSMIERGEFSKEVISREFEEAVVEVVVRKTIKAAQVFSCKQILVGGGVSANKFLREQLQLSANNLGVEVLIPDFDLCTDNAIYIASSAFFNYTPKNPAEVKANPSLGIMDLF